MPDFSVCKTVFFFLRELVSDAHQSFSVSLLGCLWFPNDIECAERPGIPEQSAQKHHHRSVCNCSSSLFVRFTLLGVNRFASIKS